jgi:HPt (histidine-containing phosphotransfer) domain-containing protein
MWQTRPDTFRWGWNMVTSMDEQLANLHRLGGEDFVREMIELFLENAPKQMEAARNGIREGDLEAVRRAVHSLKSSAGNFGAAEVPELAGRIEQLAADRQAAPIPAKFAALEAAFAQVRARLEERRGPHA